MALDPLPPDAQALIDHCERQGYHGAPLPTVWTLLRYIAVLRVRGLWARLRPHR